ncbi:agrin-like isoform X3 [Hermetia illucens]|uniref:agrin-like isoform X3 n=1 Tax=Hermetia illucens TaxID=343691 RepID=UPI0018CC0ABF|nr:agrin-like isoform X3 [Hermetia illucens]
MKEFLLSWTIVTVVVLVNGQADPCAVRCNQNVKAPVCGYNGMDYKIFQNACLMLTENCGAANVWIQHPKSHCDLMAEESKRSVEECPRICPMNYQPICATDGRTNKIFSNQCEMNVANCNENKKWLRARSNAACGGQEGMFGVVQVGDNREQEDDSCPERCEYEASYVCGFNGEQYRIFGNNCTFKLVACRSKENWTLKPLSECDGKDDWYFPLLNDP